MPERRRVVLDNSVMIPGYFQEYLPLGEQRSHSSPVASRLRVVRSAILAVRWLVT
jgi:hypothetical protein